MNRLIKEKSPYLRHSAGQKIDWYPWADEAFEMAKAEDKPVFLSSGAQWCHWCHVMAKECFENEDVIRLLNENFICIKIDRDERPEIDKRYQQAVGAMGFSGGWPLSVFLLPDRKPFFGGTYFPPDDGLGRPGLKSILNAISNFYKSKKEDAAEYSEKLLSHLKTKSLLEGEINKSILDEALSIILSQHDPQNGGFGSAPKFPMPGAIELLMSRYFFTRNGPLGFAVRKTLTSMAKGGIHDQIGGGFHRYSTDEAWIIPHFEKMAEDNAWLLRNYTNAYLIFGDEYFKEVAKGIVSFINEVLSDPDGGFYASEDADVTPEDEGGYFTWKAEDFKGLLDEDEYSILSMHYLHKKGSMHHDEAKKALFVAMEPEEIAKARGMDLERVKEIIISGRGKLIKERQRRIAPVIDKSLYTSLNGMLITSCLRASMALRDEALKDFALKSLKRITDIRYINNELLHTEGIKALLDDYVYFIEALISAYECTGDYNYLGRADALMKDCLGKFWDYKEGGFFDTKEDVLGLRLKGIEDTPHPSANSAGIIVLLKLYHLTDNAAYLEKAGEALRAFSLTSKNIGVHGGYYLCALNAYFNMLKLTLYTSPQREMSLAVLSSYIPYAAIFYGEDKGYATVCFNNTCYEPIYEPERLKDFFKSTTNLMP
ncbi:MAG: thioredoxin domain-containing protein [Nitrospirae bacterium]|nr:thioredoxin domain-containing protein [Nitrospirota bacterium]